VLERLVCLRLNFITCTLVLLRIFFLLFVCSYYFLNGSSKANKWFYVLLFVVFFHARLQVQAVDLLKMVVSMIQDSFYPFAVGLK
jgi:hypothetical protein